MAYFEAFILLLFPKASPAHVPILEPISPQPPQPSPNWPPPFIPPPLKPHPPQPANLALKLVGLIVWLLLFDKYSKGLVLT